MKAGLWDGHGRRHNNLRISVTDRCNVRCVYCMPEEVRFQPRDQLLSFEELARVARIAAGLGVDKIRLTGGEPLVRHNVAALVSRLAAIPGIVDLGLTTNGILLAEQASDLWAAGLRRLNISLDTLDREQFQRVTRRDLLDRVLDGIDAAIRCGFHPIKINAVPMKGITDDQVVPLAHYCRERGLELRFIEFMPLDADLRWSRDQVFTADAILDSLRQAGIAARPRIQSDPHAPAEEYEYEDGGGQLGIIASVSRPFCGNCNRLRLTADGKFRNCLFATTETDLREPLRAGATDDSIAALIRSSVADKWPGHLINSPRFHRPERTMHTIGG